MGLEVHRTVREIWRDLHRQREWRNELEKMKTGAPIGCVFVETKTLRNSLLPITASTLEQVNRVSSPAVPVRDLLKERGSRGRQEGLRL